MPSVRDDYVITCEHGGNDVPKAWRHLFAGREDVLRSHRGWDPGAFEFGAQLASVLEAPFVATRVTRLLVECNRSERHPKLFSEFSRNLPAEEKRELMETYYRPHRRRVVEAIQDVLRRADVAIHVGVHSFTPVWDGEERRVDVGLLYDPASPLEREICARWRDELRRVRPDLRIRRNTPYRGVSDGLTKTLRRLFNEKHGGTERYVGIELEMSQALVGSRAISSDPSTSRPVQRSPETR